MILKRINLKTGKYDRQKESEMTLVGYVNLGNGEGNEKFWFQKKIEQLENDLEQTLYKNIAIFDPHYGVCIIKGEIK